MKNIKVAYSNSSTTIRATVDEGGTSRTYLFNSTSKLLNWAEENGYCILIDDITVS